jgi:DNA-binding winged helix-turn-helix (wHTH) protein
VKEIPDKITYGKLELYNNELKIEQKSISLTKKESKIFSFLMSNAEKYVTRKDIYDHLWPGGIILDETITVHISQIKKKLGEYSNIIKTEYGKGYALIMDQNYVQLSPLENKVYNYFKNSKNKITLEEISNDKEMKGHDMNSIKVTLSHLRRKVSGIPLFNASEYKN